MGISLVYWLQVSVGIDLVLMVDGAEDAACSTVIYIIPQNYKLESCTNGRFCFNILLSIIQDYATKMKAVFFL